AGRRQPRARGLEVLELGSGRLELAAEALVLLPLAVVDGGEDGQQRERGDEGGGGSHAASSTIPPIRQSPLPSAATPIASRSCWGERRSRSPRARRWRVAGSYQIVSRANDTTIRSTGSSSGPSRRVRIRPSASPPRPSARSAAPTSVAHASQESPRPITASIRSLHRRVR